jgi:hypothetical protein
MQEGMRLYLNNLFAVFFCQMLQILLEYVMFEF